MNLLAFCCVDQELLEEILIDSGYFFAHPTVSARMTTYFLMTLSYLIMAEIFGENRAEHQNRFALFYS